MTKKKVKKAVVNKCKYCRGADKLIKTRCTQVQIGTGTLSNPSDTVWVCKKHRLRTVGL